MEESLQSTDMEVKAKIPNDLDGNHQWLSNPQLTTELSLPQSCFLQCDNCFYHIHGTYKENPSYMEIHCHYQKEQQAIWLKKSKVVPVQRHMREWRYSSTNLDFGIRWR
jgi:hypothetical protein